MIKPMKSAAAEHNASDESDSPVPLAVVEDTPADGKAPPTTAWREYVNRLLAAEISRGTRYCDELVQWRPRGSDLGILLRALDAPQKRIASNIDEIVPPASTDYRRVVLLNGNINHDHDICASLMELKPALTRSSRIVLVAYNPYLQPLYSLANKLGIRRGELPHTFVTNVDVDNICRVAGFEVVRRRTVGYSPFRLMGLGNLINRIMPAIPIFRWFSLTAVLVLRPIIPEERKPSLSIVIPARNERGNIENALKRIPDFPNTAVEVIFVEGHSTDGTWEEIERVAPLYAHRFKVQSFRQSGKGKSDAVRLGFERAEGEVLTILDADLTMPPELLPRFYDAYCMGLADFVNGNRLTYPMENAAMRPLNHLGNIFFAKALSFVLDSRIGDSLCGTKLLSKSDYARMTAWRKDFGEFDPFGDFELLFPAAILALGILDVPIRYRDRTYGSTNISRFRHGWMLLKMTLVGLFRVKLGDAS